MTHDERLRIVFADDDNTACNYFQVMLERLGHQVLAIAHDGNELVALAKSKRPDLVITDLNMPGNDGIWSAEMLDEIAGVPVIIVSGHHEPDMVNLTTARNIHAYLVKPVKIEDLKMAIAVAMRKAFERSEAREKGCVKEGTPAHNRDAPAP